MDESETKLYEAIDGALQKVVSEAITPPAFAWHSSTIAEDGASLTVLFDSDDGRVWGFTLDTSQPLDGQAVTFGRVDE